MRHYNTILIQMLKMFSRWRNPTTSHFLNKGLFGKTDNALKEGVNSLKNCGAKLITNADKNTVFSFNARRIRVSWIVSIPPDRLNNLSESLLSGCF